MLLYWKDWQIVVFLGQGTQDGGEGPCQQVVSGTLTG